MAALLRHGAARRFGGSMVQRARATITDERRQLGPRLMHTEEQTHHEIMREVQQKKEELYDLIREEENTARTSSWDNSRLLVRLSEDVNPRYDRRWHELQITRRGIARFKVVRLFVLYCTAVEFHIRYKRYRDAKVAQAMMIEQEHEAREVETGSHLMEN